MAYVTVDVDLSDFSDEEIADEYIARELGYPSHETYVRASQLVQYIRCGDIHIKGKFGNELVDFLFDISNKVV